MSRAGLNPLQGGSKVVTRTTVSRLVPLSKRSLPRPPPRGNISQQSVVTQALRISRSSPNSRSFGAKLHLPCMKSTQASPFSTCEKLSIGPTQRDGPTLKRMTASFYSTTFPIWARRPYSATRATRRKRARSPEQISQRAHAQPHRTQDHRPVDSLYRRGRHRAVSGLVDVARLRFVESDSAPRAAGPARPAQERVHNAALSISLSRKAASPFDACGSRQPN